MSDLFFVVLQFDNSNDNAVFFFLNVVDFQLIIEFLVVPLGSDCIYYFCKVLTLLPYLSLTLEKFLVVQQYEVHCLIFTSLEIM